MTDINVAKSKLRKDLRAKLGSMSEAARHSQSIAACSLLASSPEFTSAKCIMLYLSTPTELDTAPLALKAWQAGKTVVVPKVSWDQKRILPTEITSLHHDNMTTTGPGVREPISGMPVPTSFIDLVIVPGLGFSPTGNRIGRGMGFYDRFLGGEDFMGVSCGLAFEEQLVEDLPVLDHDVSLSMLVTNQGIRRFASSCIQKSW